MTAQPERETRRTARQRALGWVPGAAQALWVAFPLRVARWFPTVGAGLTDGLYLLRWPPLAICGSPLALLLGLLLGARHPGYTFTESLPLLLILTAVGLGSAQLGMAALLGYVVGDFALHDSDLPGIPGRVLRASPLEQFLRLQVPRLTSYYLLALLTAGVPLAAVIARGQLRQVPLPATVRRYLDPLLAGAGSAAVAGALAYAWASAAPVLIRPVFTWAGGQPTPQAIQPLQSASVPFALGIAVLAALRVLVERLATTPAIAQAATAVQVAIVQTIRSRRPGRLSRPLGIGVGALGLTLLMAGMVTTLAEGALLYLFLAALLTLRDLLQRLDWLPLRLLGRVPLLLRYALGLLLAYIASREIVGRNWRSEETFLPVLLATCASLLIITLLTLQPQGRPEPPPEAAGPEPEQEGEGRARPAWPAGVAGMALLLAYLLDAPPAYAHNCGSLSDCFQMLAIALAVIAAIALIVALVIATGGGGGIALAVAGGGSLAAGSAISATAVTAAQVAAASAVAAAAAQSLAMATAGEGGGGGQGDSGGDEQGGGGQGGGGQGGEGARRAEEAVTRARNDPAKQDHIFNNPRHDHQWGRTGQDLDGNWNLIRQTLESNWNGIRGAGGSPFEVTRTFGNVSVTVRGRLVNGVIRIGTAFVNAVP
jgi:hypothetical protein